MKHEYDQDLLEMPERSLALLGNLDNKLFDDPLPAKNVKVIAAG